VKSIVKKAVIIFFSLVQETIEVANEKIKKDISDEFSNEWTRIPWLKEIEKITVTEEQ
jgi:hypothetical protein